MHADLPRSKSYCPLPRHGVSRDASLLRVQTNFAENERIENKTYQKPDFSKQNAHADINRNLRQSFSEKQNLPIADDPKKHMGRKKDFVA